MMGHIRKAIMKLTSVIIVIAVTFITVSCSSQKKGTAYSVYFLNEDGTSLTEGRVYIESQDAVSVANELLEKMNVAKGRHTSIIKPVSVSQPTVEINGIYAGVYYEEILKLKGVEEMVEVYYNSGQFQKTIRAMEHLFETAFSMYEELADFYEKNGYNEVSHTRIRRYEILQEFLQEKEANLEYFKQLMIFDLYARENMKTRPQWANDLSAYKMQILDFYKKEEENPELLTDYQGYQARQTIKMTHIEVFTYDVINENEEKGAYPVLFDYKKRSPLTNDAKAVFVQL